MSEFTLIHPEGVATMEASVTGGDVRVAPESVATSLGWHLRDEGLCRGDVCVPVADRAALVDERGIALTALAGALGLPLAVDVEASAAAVGTSHVARSAGLADGIAPDFSLPDVSGQLHSLSEHRGKKVLLIAYASW